VVVSAMGKTTNKLEEIAHAFYHKDELTFNLHVSELEAFHNEISNELFDDEHAEIHQILKQEVDRLKRWYVASVPENFSYLYDQLVSVGELMSSQILNAFLTKESILSEWVDARTLIRTDSSYQEGKVNWHKTETLIADQLQPLFKDKDIVVTQGFIGHTSEGFTTTLGREGSDYTAGIMAYCLNAENVTIWKDVPGMLNADPKQFTDTIKLTQISFKEAIELSYYGASVIHPKTIQPLQNKGIPLFVKSFLQPDEPGTIIQASTAQDHLIPSFIVKSDQLLISITTKDFSFIAEEHLSDIFARLNRMGLHVNLMQNSALDFSMVLDQKKVPIESFLDHFTDHYVVRYNQGLELVTIRHYNDNVISKLTHEKVVLLEQRTRQTARLVLKPEV
jgi:aspartate kinase